MQHVQLDRYRRQIIWQIYHENSNINYPYFISDIYFVTTQV